MDQLKAIPSTKYQQIWVKISQNGITGCSNTGWYSAIVLPERRGRSDIIVFNLFLCVACTLQQGNRCNGNSDLMIRQFCVPRCTSQSRMVTRLIPIVLKIIGSDRSIRKYAKIPCRDFPLPHDAQEYSGHKCWLFVATTPSNQALPRALIIRK